MLALRVLGVMAAIAAVRTHCKLTPTGQTLVKPKTRRYSDRGGSLDQESFLERLQRLAYADPRKSEVTRGALAAQLHNAECTFAPLINPRSARMVQVGRSCVWGGGRGREHLTEPVCALLTPLSNVASQRPRCTATHNHTHTHARARRPRPCRSCMRTAAVLLAAPQSRSRWTRSSRPPAPSRPTSRPAAPPPRRRGAAAAVVAVAVGTQQQAAGERSSSSSSSSSSGGSRALLRHVPVGLAAAVAAAPAGPGSAACRQRWVRGWCWWCSLRQLVLPHPPLTCTSHTC
jgi:hypothetical protein